jgi:hypothetical protein
LGEKGSIAVLQKVALKRGYQDGLKGDSARAKTEENFRKSTTNLLRMVFWAEIEKSNGPSKSLIQQQ